VDREKLLARKRRYHERHLDEERERSRRWREANKERVREVNRMRRESHPGEGYAGVKRWREANPDLQQASARASACNRRAKAAGASGHITRADVTALWERQPVCLRCGVGRGVDHIVDFRHGGLNTPENLQNLCRTCNELKAAKLTLEIAREIRASYGSNPCREYWAHRYGVSPGNIWLIITNQIWKEPL
jgi:5-methylcytosine-specific restriction endonuclease McrA